MTELLRAEVPPYESVIQGGFTISRELGAPICLLRGENGAGKSTVLKLLVGLLRGNGRPSLWYGDQQFHPHRDASLVRYLPQNADDGLFTRLSVVDNSRLLRLLLGVDAQAQAKRLSLPDAAPAWHLSVGQQRLFLLSSLLASVRADATSGKPRVVMLDEPLAGLDSEKRREAFADIVATATQLKAHNCAMMVVVDHAHLDPTVEAAKATVTVRPGVNLELIHAPALVLR